VGLQLSPTVKSKFLFFSVFGFFALISERVSTVDESKLYGELTPSGGGDPIPLLKRKLLIGRRPSCDITLRFANVSSHHCELELMNGYWFVRDLGSANGIKVNDSRCDQKWVFPGDTLTVARHRYEMSYHGLGERPEEEEENPFEKGLLEKAGLAGEGRRKRIPEPIELPKERTDDDVAMEWLMGDR
jgi:hypothetical protein